MDPKYNNEYNIPPPPKVIPSITRRRTKRPLPPQNLTNNTIQWPKIPNLPEVVDLSTLPDTPSQSTNIIDFTEISQTQNPYESFFNKPPSNRFAKMNIPLYPATYEEARQQIINRQKKEQNKLKQKSFYYPSLNPQEQQYYESAVTPPSTPSLQSNEPFNTNIFFDQHN